MNVPYLMNKYAHWKFKFILLMTSIIFSFLLTIGFDRLLLSAFVRNEPTGLIYPPRQHIHYQTPEFSVTATINSLGFRDREFDINHKQGLRIVIIGDSFTYGWGVADQATFPKLLEQQLLEHGHKVEIANLGISGGSPRDYAQLAAKAIPLLQPDVTIVAILQGDDLAQLKQEAQTQKQMSAQTSPISNATNVLKSMVRGLYPNTFVFLSRRLATNPSLEQTWKEQANQLIKDFSSEEKERFARIDESARTTFRQGQLNPFLINASIKTPDYFLETLDTHSVWIETMSQYLAQIKDITTQQGSKLIILSVPYGIYVSERDYHSRGRLGFTLRPDLLTTTAPDDAIHLASEKNGLPFFSVTEGFRHIAKQEILFFEMDGHFTAQGHQRFAELLTPLVEKNVLATFK